MKPLTVEQQSILYTLLTHMVNAKEINFAAAYAKETTPPTYFAAGKKIIEGLYELSTLLPGGSVRSINEESRTPTGLLTRAVSTLFLSGMLESHQYLAKHFSVERSRFYFPGITLKNDTVEDGNDAELFEHEPGELAVEFPSEECRDSLIKELETWAKVDPEFCERPDGTLAKVRSALAASALVAA